MSPAHITHALTASCFAFFATLLAWTGCILLGTSPSHKDDASAQIGCLIQYWLAPLTFVHPEPLLPTVATNPTPACIIPSPQTYPAAKKEKNTLGCVVPSQIPMCTKAQGSHSGHGCSPRCAARRALGSACSCSPLSFE